MQLDTYFPYRLAVAAEAFSRKLVEVYGRRYGLSREEWRLLLLLAEAGELTSLELSRRTTLDKVQVSRAAARLQAKGLIARTVSSTDRRLRVYTCEPRGEALFAEAFPQVEARADQILSAMSATDRAALSAGVDALIRAVDAAGETDGPGAK